MKFDFSTAGHILFGPGSVKGTADQVLPFGRHVLFVSGQLRAEAAALIQDLQVRDLRVTLFKVTEEPNINAVESGARLSREAGCDLVIGFGGGSALDAAKAIAALTTNPGSALDYLEVVGKGRPFENPPLPIVAIPTTAGTGSEVTRNAVITLPQKKIKVSLRHPMMLPRVAIVDPALTYRLPPEVTAYTGMDALTQLIEPYLSVAANPITDGFCVEGITRIARSLRRVFEEGSDMIAREDMALASLLGGLALANSRLGAVHGIASPLGGMFQAPHGAICARLLPIVLRANLKALEKRKPDAMAIQRFQKVAELLTANLDATAEDGIDWLEETCLLFKIPPLSDYGVRAGDISAIVRQARDSSSMKGNPIELSDADLGDILKAAL